MNNEGYYLYNVENDKTFGFMFDEKKNNSLTNEKPELWDYIQTKIQDFMKIKIILCIL